MENIFLSGSRISRLSVGFLFLVQFGFLPFMLSAQSNFSEGFIITNQGDTIEGFIDAKDKMIYSACTFKKDLDDAATNYNPEQLMAFRITDGKYFQSRIITIDASSKHVFLEYLVKGKANIYYYRDTDDHYFIETEIVDLLELTAKTVTIAGDYGAYEMPKRHKTKLKAVLSDSEQTQSKIESVSLNHRSLTNLAVAYHYDVCDTEDCIVFEKKKVKLKWNFTAFLGYGYAQIDLGSELKSNVSGSPTFGGRVELGNFLPWTERISVSLDVSFQNYSTTSFAILYDESIRFSLDGEDFVYVNNRFYDNRKEELHADIDMTVLKLPISLFYAFGENKIKPYLGIGMMNQIVLSQNEDFLYDRFVDVFGKTIPSYQIGVAASFGTKFFLNANQAINLELNYEYASNLNINKSLKLKSSVFGVKLGFQFK